ATITMTAGAHSSQPRRRSCRAPSERAALPFFVASGAVLVPPGGGGVPSGPAMVLIRNRPGGGPARDAGRRSAAGGGGSLDHRLGFQGIVDLTLGGGDRALRLDRGRRGPA